MSQEIDGQILYLGRWVSRKHFRAFVYNSTDCKLVNSYNEFCSLISSGAWFAEKPIEVTIEPVVELVAEPVAEVVNDESIPLENVVEIKPKRGRKCRSQDKV